MKTFKEFLEEEFNKNNISAWVQKIRSDVGLTADKTDILEYLDRHGAPEDVVRRVLQTLKK